MIRKEIDLKCNYWDSKKKGHWMNKSAKRFKKNTSGSFLSRITVELFYTSVNKIFL